MTASNAYCQHLGIEPPDVDGLARRGAKLFHLMVASLLERGGPMTLAELVGRLSSAGVRPWTGDLGLSLQKAWHGLPPVLRDPQGRYHLHLQAWQLRYLLHELQPSGPNKAPTKEPPPQPPPVELARDDRKPLTWDEVELAFVDRNLHYLSPLRQAVAVLDAVQAPLSAEDLEARLAPLTPWRFPISEETARGWRKLVDLDPEGLLVLDEASPDLPAVRRKVREMAATGLERRVEAERTERAISGWEERQAAEERWRAEEARRLRRALVHALPSRRDPRAVAVLDLASREIGTFIDDLEGTRQALAAYDWLAGLEIRDFLWTLGLDPSRCRLAELGPPKKSHQLNRSGRRLRITPELLIRGTTGVSRPLADGRKVAGYLRNGQTGRLLRRLESDVKALHAFYRYGALHGYVRLRWGFLDDTLGVDWRLAGEPELYLMLKEAAATGRLLEAVVGSAPGWAEPWSRGQRVRVRVYERWVVEVETEDGERFDIWDERDIQAARWAE